MEPQTFRVGLSQAAYARGISVISGELARLDTSRGRMLAARLVVTVIALLIVIAVTPSAIPGLLLACLLFWLGELAVQAGFRTVAFGHSFEPKVHAETLVTFDETGVREEGKIRARSWPWAALRRVHVAGEEMVIEFAGWDMVVLPADLWPSPGDRAAFVTLLKERAPQAAVAEVAASPEERGQRLRLTEPMMLARLALAVLAYQLIVEAGLRLGAFGAAGQTLLWLGGGVMGGAAIWFLSGWALRAIARRSAAAALYLSWGVLALLVTAFALWYLAAG